MKIRLFVSCSASVLILWLGVTYVREVPYQHYPKLGEDSLPISAEVKPAVAPAAVIGLMEEAHTASLVVGE